jgi:hypothetical protein
MSPKSITFPCRQKANSYWRQPLLVLSFVKTQLTQCLKQLINILKDYF